jgi:hypothetical protein
MPTLRDYDVGYGKPPVHGQFKLGVSGNPSGGKKGRRSLKTDFEAELLEVVTVTENGKILKLSKQQLVVKALTAKAAKGDTAAIGKVIDLIRDICGLGVEPDVDRDQVSADDEEVIQAYMARKLPDKPGGDDD